LPAAIRFPVPPPATVVVNELTTVASAYAAAQFISGGALAGPEPGLPNAADFVAHIANVETGLLGPTISDDINTAIDPNSSAPVHSLANAIAACTVDIARCAELLTLGTPAGETAPTNTFEAIARVADVPTSNVDALFALTQVGPTPYAPALTAVPDAWTVGLLFDGDGQTIDGPGQFAVDAEGRVWIGNNYIWSPGSTTPTCAGKRIMVLNPTVVGPSNLQAFPGGGVDGVGYGITLDATGNIWVGNYGFAGEGCTVPVSERTISEFTPNGMPVSPATGYDEGEINQPQGMGGDLEGNVWTANCGSNSVTVYPDGDQDRAANFPVPGMVNPFGLAMDSKANAWVAANGSSQLYAFQPDGSQLPGSPFSGGGMLNPMAVAVDSADNVWVANLRFPFGQQCGPASLDGVDIEGSVSWFGPDGTPMRDTRISGGGMWNSWGIAVDGDDHVWVASFGRQRVTEICGANDATCPEGVGAGEPISPDEGYGYDGLLRNTGLAVDQSGNVWLANNWLNDPFGVNQANPGGKDMAVFVGVAGPVDGPLVRGAADDGIALTKTVGTDPNVCGTESTIIVEPGTTVYYCYTVTNTGALPLDFHTLVDDRLGEILSEAGFDLQPGANVNTVQLGVPAETVSAVVDASVTNTAVWLAEGLSYEAEATATATVNVGDPPPTTTPPPTTGPTTTVHNRLPDTGNTSAPTAWIAAATLLFGAVLLILSRRPTRRA
ncbi:MAG: NHL repeat-containing protein, partial [Actinomycetota bacterium]